jgi:hypothetical protein
MRSLLLVAAMCVFPGKAFAQADANPVKSASDAFGHRRGDEAIGLYDERSVRGFSLEAAGNYRLNGTYFVKNSGVSNIFIDSSTVRIGYNTLATLLPGPSGLVDYKLRDPQPGEKSLLTLTYDVYGQPIAELNLRHGSASGNSSYSVGISRNFDLRNAQGGTGGEDLLAGSLVCQAPRRAFKSSQASINIADAGSFVSARQATRCPSASLGAGIWVRPGLSTKANGVLRECWSILIFPAAAASA